MNAIHPTPARTQGLKPAVDILGVPVNQVDKTQLLDQVRAWASDGDRRTIMYVNAHCLNVALGDLEHRDILRRADLVYADGIGVVWAGRLLHGAHLEKITGRDWIYDLCDLAAEDGLRLFILAGEPRVAHQARDHLQQRWPALRIVGANDGYFTEVSEAETLLAIAETAPHILLVGMSTPRQEKWLATYRAQISAPVAWTVGALFDYVAGIEPPVPAWMNALALEWLWRMLVDPTGKWRRYLVGNPQFAYQLIRQYLRSRETKG